MVSPKTHDVSAYYDKSQLDPYVKKQNAKLIQVIQNFFTKSVQIILQSRLFSDSDISLENNPHVKVNKWFNMHMSNNLDTLKDDLKLWKNFTEVNKVPPMIIETYLDLRQTSSRDTVMLKDDNDNRWTVAKGGGKKQEVVLERWLIEFDRNDVSGSFIDELPLIYKQAIILFRSLYAFTRLMPAYKLKKSLSQSKSKKSLIIGNKVLDGNHPISSKGRIGLSKSIIPHQMLTTESHMSQKHFSPIQTTLGTLKISIAYRNHYDFITSDNEVVLSNHFVNMDENHDQKVEDKVEDHEELANDLADDINREHLKPDSQKQQKRSSLNSNSSLSPSTSNNQLNDDQNVSKRANVQRPTIQPFKIGSISNSPPSHTGGGSLLERRISITSNKSTSNASLAALLRNPRGSTSSNSTTNNIPIANQNTVSFPRSILSSHGSQLPHDELNSPFSNPESITNTPRFSSSFGSRASRRFSNSSIKHTPLQDTNILGSSVGLTSSGAPLSGLYIDDDISDFVKMIDSKSELRFSNPGSKLSSSKLSPPSQGSNSQLDALNKFQLLKNQHQQLGDSVSASLILQHNQVNNSRPSSRKSSHSIYSPSPSLQSNSLDKHAPSINSRLKDPTPESHESIGLSRKNSHNASFLKSSSTHKLLSTPVTSTTKTHAVHHKLNETRAGSNDAKTVSGMATTPSAYKAIHYENVFDDDDDDGEDYYLSNQSKKQSQSPSLKNNQSNHEDEEDDDLLFTMSDMNVTK
ncbi:hypothetical protein HYPBUDRAFT_8239 [Hyphopichia burtonii NRRL Y-1933]|uniref:Autophagy-related protein 13 n=1 Tax=Hyphopichia burtonii NRRL Y-1933 TaxID=984485 RepID=A0A1E4RDI8_9ASCO|nr:hypothetical protein HYPBUDRAFT_8239 [Hyphopichia burtonii NRRL Y-1933]ODV65339.1 hypothetical protein HYPBUDRAFT_8239 [Hyphopichia burtonii NRRL Y-1933]